jgi:hypothetical protein
LAQKVDEAVGGDNLTMTGHSLGGGLAAAAALETNRPAVTFNAAGLNILTELFGGGLSYSNDARNYSVQGELLTLLQTHTLLPEAFGDQYEIKPAPGDAGDSPLQLHEMQTVLNALPV